MAIDTTKTISQVFYNNISIPLAGSSSADCVHLQYTPTSAGAATIYTGVKGKYPMALCIYSPGFQADPTNSQYAVGVHGYIMFRGNFWRNTSNTEPASNTCSYIVLQYYDTDNNYIRSGESGNQEQFDGNGPWGGTAVVECRAAGGSASDDDYIKITCATDSAFLVGELYEVFVIY